MLYEETLPDAPVVAVGSHGEVDIGVVSTEHKA